MDEIRAGKFIFSQNFTGLKKVEICKKCTIGNYGVLFVDAENHETGVCKQGAFILIK